MRRVLYRWLLIGIFFMLVIFGCIEVMKRPLQKTPSPPPLASQLHDSDVALSVFDAKAYYSPIVENNLFRPLGWRPKPSIERYRLLGTIIPTNTNTPPKAIIKTTIGSQTYIVTPGQKLDATTEVIDIQSKQVTLSKDGIHRTLQLPSAF